MKAGYAVLFGVVLGYSAYQGIGASSSESPEDAAASKRATVQATETRQSTSVSSVAEAFPTIGGGICRLAVTGGTAPPCSECKAICPAGDLTGLIGDYFRAESGSDDAYLSAHWNVPKAEQSHIKFVFASLPDPVHTHMALLFDRGIDALQSSAQASGYFLSRAWMPWDISTHPESTDFTVRMALREYRDQVESLPGLLIFRSPSARDETQSLFVFVTGETPTAGIHVEQFQNALKIRQSMLQNSDPGLPENHILRIYGPEFSGSLESLNAILKAQPHDRYSRILIRSGTVSGYRATQKFYQSLKSNWPAPDVPVTRDQREVPVPGRPDFATFQFTDCYQEYYLGEFFKEREQSHSRVAILSEDETEYGSQGELSPEEGPPSQASEENCAGEPVDSQFQFLRLYFPREIAHLRDAYQRDVPTQAAAGGTKNASQTGLTLSLGVSGNDDDTVAPYSPLQTPLSQESILQALVFALRKNHVRVVVIRATDPLDMIFLARYLRQNYPQARLVTVGADLLVARTNDDPRFQGILAVTPYPLIAGASFPKQPRARDQKTQDEKTSELVRLFPDSYSTGIFNAFQSLLALDATDPQSLPAARYEQFGYPAFLTADSLPWSAHLWLMAVGRGAYWPVAILDDAAAKSQGLDKRPEPTIPPVEGTPLVRSPNIVHLPIGWVLLWVLALAPTLFLAFALRFPGAFTHSETLGRFSGTPSNERNRLLFAGSMLLLALQTLFVYPVIVWLGHSEQSGMWLLGLCYLASIAALGYAVAWGFKARESDRLGRAGAIVCGVVIGVAFAATLWMWFGNVDRQLGAFIYRYIQIGSGVSGLVPLFCGLGAWIWWCWQTLTGVTATSEKHVLLPTVNDLNKLMTPSNLRSTSGAYDRVRLKALSTTATQWPLRTLEAMPFGRKEWIPAVVGALMILALMHPKEIAEAFESRWYKWLYWILLYSCLFLVCYLVTHIVALWLEFRHLLRTIERMPFRRGFGDLKSMTWKPLWKLAGSGRQEFVQLLEREMDSLTQIRNIEIMDNPFGSAIKEVKDATDAVSAAYEPVIDGAGGPASADQVRKSFYTLQERMASAAAAALVYASDQWKKEKYSPPPSKTDYYGTESEYKRAGGEPPATDLKLRAVERFLCLFYLIAILVPLRRLQTLILAMAGVYVFVLISYSSYPFESRESFHVLLISIFFAISLVVGVVYGQMYANPLLSRITNTKPGELGLDFWVRMATFVFVPLLSLLSVQFPAINNFLFSWLQPALQSIK